MSQLVIDGKRSNVIFCFEALYSSNFGEKCLCLCNFGLQKGVKGIVRGNSRCKEFYSVVWTWIWGWIFEVRREMDWSHSRIWLLGTVWMLMSLNAAGAVSKARAAEAVPILIVISSSIAWTWVLGSYSASVVSIISRIGLRVIEKRKDDKPLPCCTPCELQMTAMEWSM